MNSLPKTVTRHRRDCDLNPGPSAPEYSTLTTRLPSHPLLTLLVIAKFHYTGPTGPARTFCDPDLRETPLGSRGSGRVRAGPCNGI